MRPELLRVDPSDDAAIDAYHVVAAAARAHDFPDLPALTLARSTLSIRNPRPTIDMSYFVARLDGQPVATLSTEMPTADNTHAVEMQITVHPDWRRRGIARAIFADAVAFARDAGRRVLIGNYREALPDRLGDDPAPAAFAAAVGVQRALPEVRRRLDLSTVDESTWRSLQADAAPHAQGYKVVWWIGDVPEELLPGVAYLESRMVTDAPMGDLDVGPENFDADRIRAADEALRRRDSVRYHAGALAASTGQLVAWSALVIEAEAPHHAWQGTTIVDPDHRGHRLGLLVKLENLIRTHEACPQLREIDTWNAAENAHMIAINEAVGFRPVDAWVTWQCDIAAA